MRGRAQHHPGALRRLRRAPVPGAPVLGQLHHQHLPAQRGRGRQRRHPELLLLRHDLRHHRDLRPVRQRQQPDRRPGRRRGRGPDGLANATAAPVTVDGQAAYGVYIAPGDGYRDDNTKNIATGNNPEARRHLRRHALQRRLLLRLRQRRDQQRRRRRRHHGSHLLRQHQGLGLRHRQRPLDHGRHGERPVLGRQRRRQRQRPHHQLPVHHRHGRGRRRTSGPSSAATPSPEPSPPTTAASAPPATTR